MFSKRRNSLDRACSGNTGCRSGFLCDFLFDIVASWYCLLRNPLKILVTGGTGYIGSHTVLSLQEAGHDVVVIDNLINSGEESLRRVAELTGKTAEFHKMDLVNEAAVEQVFAGAAAIDAVIHFAGLKAVGESVQEPLKYYYNNLVGTLNLIRVMDRHDVRSFDFSSSATVYGEHNPIPYVEKM
jgi:UDP-glucose 4-epimerase